MLILDYCIDIILFLIKNSEFVVAINCKAGKGRTRVMVCCYLIFSGLCKSADEALFLQRRALVLIFVIYFTGK